MEGVHAAAMQINSGRADHGPARLSQAIAAPASLLSPAARLPPPPPLVAGRRPLPLPLRLLHPPQPSP